MDEIEIRPLREEELRLLDAMNEGWPYGRPIGLHRQRLEMQQGGDAIYLFAWHGARPVAHAFLRLRSFGGGGSGEVGQEGAAHLTDLFVIPPYWSRGIGSRLIRVCEDLARQNGCKQLGLNVAEDNERGLSLYKSTGYQDPGFERRRSRWTYLNPAGEEEAREDTLIFLLKSLV